MYRITSKHNGFIRCGVRHPSAATEYSDDHFSHDEIMILEAEPMLVVQHFDGESDESSDSGGDEKDEAEKIAEALDSARQMALVEADKNGREDAPEYFFNQDLFKSIGWVLAQKVAKDLYGVVDNSWKKLWEEFSAAQTAAFAKGTE